MWYEHFPLHYAWPQPRPRLPLWPLPWVISAVPGLWKAALTESKTNEVATNICACCPARADGPTVEQKRGQFGYCTPTKVAQPQELSPVFLDGITLDLVCESVRVSQVDTHGVRGDSVN